MKLQQSKYLDDYETSDREFKEYFIRKIVTFVRSHQPTFTVAENKHKEKVHPDCFYFCELYDRRSELSKDSREYCESMDEIYIKEAMRRYG